MAGVTSEASVTATAGITAEAQSIATVSETAEVSDNAAAGVTAEAKKLAKYVIYTLCGKHNGDSSTKTERTLLRCVNKMIRKHDIWFNALSKKVQITRETGYTSFVNVANTLFENEKMVVTWSRIVALYALAGQLALECKEKGMEDLAFSIADYISLYFNEVLSPYVTYLGGWNQFCDEFPEEVDLENQVRRVLSWTAVGLGVVATLSYLTSR